MLSSEEGCHELQTKLDRINILVISLIAILGALIIFFSKSLLLYFGRTYTHSSTALIILTIGMCLGCLAIFLQCYWLCGF